jgi:Cu2+-containing amine oxidase
MLIREVSMHTKAQLAAADVLMACRALCDFRRQAMAILQHGVPYPLDDQERVELKRAIQLLRWTLDSVDPFIFDTIHLVNKSAKKPTLRLV